MFRTAILSLLLLSFVANVLLFREINKEKESLEEAVLLENTSEELTSYTVDPSKVYFLGDYCRVTTYIELFNFNKEVFQVWNKVGSSIEKTKSLKPDAIGNWSILDSFTANFDLLYSGENDDGEVGSFKINLVTVGVTGKVIAFSTGEDNLLYDLRNCF